MKQERSHPVMTFKIDYYEISCSLHDNKLKVHVSSIGKNNQSTRIILQKMNSHQGGIQMSFIGFNQTKQANLMKQDRKDVQKLNYNYLNNSSQLKRQQINSYLKTKLNSTKFIKGELSNQQIFTGNAKLQLLNQMLQQKIVQKDKNLFQTQIKLYQREELIKELADKLIIANQQKDDIFNQYQKILQNTIFSHNWQKQINSPQDKAKSLIISQLRESGDLQLLMKKQLMRNENSDKKEEETQQKSTKDNKITQLLQNL